MCVCVCDAAQIWNVISPSARELVWGLLEKDPEKRCARACVRVCMLCFTLVLCVCVCARAR